MPSQTPVESYAPVRSRVRPPDLRSSRKFVRLRRVPVIDVNSRKYRKGDKIVEEHLDEQQLHTICRNSQERASKGEYGLLFLGHTTDGGKEIDQPPVVGYIKNYQVGRHNDRPTIVADAYIYRDSDPDHILRQFPRRSAEIIGLEEPDGYVDSLSLIKRAPERDLGLITHYQLDHPASEEQGSVVRFQSRNYVYRFACPAETPDRFCPEHDEGEHDMPMSMSRDAKLLKLMKHLVQGILEEVAGEEEGLGEEEGFEGEEEGLEPSEMMEGEGEEEGLEPSGEMGDDEGFEPSEPSRHRHESHYAMDPSDPSDSSDPSEPSQMHNHRHKSRHESARPPEREVSQRPARHRQKPSADPEMIKKPARHSVSGAAGGGYPDTSTSFPTTDGGSRRSRVPGSQNPPGKARLRKEGREVSRSEPITDPKRPVSRMRRDSERTAVSRYQREVLDLKATVAELQKGRLADQRTAREAVMERQVIQLESEGFVLDRGTEVSRFMKCSDDKDVKRYAAHIRKFYKRSPVNQPMLPDVFADSTRMGDDGDVSPVDYATIDTDADGVEIVGSGISRFAMGDDGCKDLNGLAMEDRGMRAIDRFRESRKPSRGRRSEEE